MTKLILDGIVEYDFRRLNTRDKCEFLAHFPEEGTVLKHMAETGVFSEITKEALICRLRKYTHFFDITKMEDLRFKLMVLNEEGKFLQQAARYMMITNEEINNFLGTQKDYLNIFPEKINPKTMLEILTRIYSCGVIKRTELCDSEAPTTVRAVVDRLKTFDLVDLGRIKNRRVYQKTLVKTEAGNLYYHRLFSPVRDFILATHLKENTDLIRCLNGNWETYIKENGNGWADKLKAL